MYNFTRSLSPSRRGKMLLIENCSSFFASRTELLIRELRGGAQRLFLTPSLYPPTPGHNGPCCGEDWRALQRLLSPPLPPCVAGPHDGSPASHSPFGPHVPTKDWCPFHVRRGREGGMLKCSAHRAAARRLTCPTPSLQMYRSSTDIAPVYGSVLSNLESIPPLAAANLSTPGCWAYPGA